jgi:hypothetical protein
MRRPLRAVSRSGKRAFSAPDAPLEDVARM